jgi:hypothetical protein
MRRLECRRVLKLLEVMSVRPIPNVDFRLERLATPFAFHPRASMPLNVVVVAEGVPHVSAEAAVPRVEILGVVADPVAATISLGQMRLRLSAQAAPLTRWPTLEGE